MVRRHLARLFVTGLIIFVEVVPPHGIFVQRFGKAVPRLGRVDGCWPSSLTRQSGGWDYEFAATDGDDDDEEVVEATTLH